MYQPVGSFMVQVMPMSLVQVWLVPECFPVPSCLHTHLVHTVGLTVHVEQVAFLDFYLLPSSLDFSSRTLPLVPAWPAPRLAWWYLQPWHSHPSEAWLSLLLILLRPPAKASHPLNTRGCLFTPRPSGWLPVLMEYSLLFRGRMTSLPEVCLLRDNRRAGTMGHYSFGLEGPLYTRL